MRVTKPPMIACHHGDSLNQNNLDAARRIMQKYPEITIMEIDFILYNDKLVSSHDYTSISILNGSLLEEWIDLVVVQYGKKLWIDLKPNVSVYALFYSNAVDFARCLFERLEEKRDLTRNMIDIKPHIIISSQDTAIVEEVDLLNHQRGWRTLCDVPRLKRYIMQAFLPPGLQEWLNDMVYDELTFQYDFSGFNMVAIDKSFFDHDIQRLFRFIEKSNIKEGSTIILYNFKMNIAPLVHPKYNIVMQYDFA